MIENKKERKKREKKRERKRERKKERKKKRGKRRETRERGVFYARASRADSNHLIGSKMSPNWM